jgi:hypothetical protein
MRPWPDGKSALQNYYSGHGERLEPALNEIQRGLRMPPAAAIARLAANSNVRLGRLTPSGLGAVSSRVAACESVEAEMLDDVGQVGCKAGPKA